MLRLSVYSVKRLDASDDSCSSSASAALGHSSPSEPSIIVIVAQSRSKILSTSVVADKKRVGRSLRPDRGALFPPLAVRRRYRRWQAGSFADSRSSRPKLRQWLGSAFASDEGGESGGPPVRAQRTSAKPGESLPRPYICDMPSMSEIISEYTDLFESDHHWLKLSSRSGSCRLIRAS